MTEVKGKQMMKGNKKSMRSRNTYRERSRCKLDGIKRAE